MIGIAAMVKITATWPLSAPIKRRAAWRMGRKMNEPNIGNHRGWSQDWTGVRTDVRTAAWARQAISGATAKRVGHRAGEIALNAAKPAIRGPEPAPIVNIR